MDMLFDKAAGQGFVVLLLLAAVVIIGRMLQGTLKDRVTDLKDRIVALEGSVTTHQEGLRKCEEDRAALWARLGGKPTEAAAHGTSGGR
jgi:hypothetical protein